jgi:hypothetical protein
MHISACPEDKTNGKKLQKIRGLENKKKHYRVCPERWSI